ncbi:MAG: glucose-6-phosphate dehydrogenase, partial [Candidatus Saccharimonadales bacterium]
MDDDAKIELQPATIVIFGITGDLSTRKLLPSLYELSKNRLLPKQTRILGITNDASNLRTLLKRARAGIKAKDGRVNARELKKLGKIIELRQMNAVEPHDYPELKSKLDYIEEEAGACTTRIFYLAVPPKIVPQIITNLGEYGLNYGCEKHCARSRLLLEKPFGFDVETAERLINTTTKYFKEDQIFRIDHYLAKETVQNIVTFRFRNPVFEDTWNNAHIKRIEISADEKLDIEDRGRFYEQTGALRDLIQSHLLHVMSVVMMDRPIDIADADDMHACRVRLLESIEPVKLKDAVRGQYDGYKNEAGNRHSHVETFAALKLYSRAERWYGVPIIVKTGKALQAKETRISIYFKPELVDHGHANRLDFYIQPRE